MDLMVRVKRLEANDQLENSVKFSLELGGYCSKEQFEEMLKLTYADMSKIQFVKRDDDGLVVVLKD